MKVFEDLTVLWFSHVLVLSRMWIGNVSFLSMESSLRMDGLLELDSLRVGRNMFIGGRGINLLKRGLVDFSNMDLNLDGELIVKKIRTDNLEGNISINGKVKIGNGLILNGDIGIEMDGIKIGKWERGNRVALLVEMGDTIWNEGVKGVGKGKGIVVEGDGEIGGRLEVGSLKVRNERIGKTRELEEEDIEKIIGEMDVEMGEDGELKMDGGDIWGIIKKMAAVIKWQSDKIKKLE